MDTVLKLQTAAFTLLDRMIEEGKWQSVYFLL